MKFLFREMNLLQIVEEELRSILSTAAEVNMPKLKFDGTTTFSWWKRSHTAFERSVEIRKTLSYEAQIPKVEVEKLINKAYFVIVIHMICHIQNI